jgi:heat shock protein HslJ
MHRSISTAAAAVVLALVAGCGNDSEPAAEAGSWATSDLIGEWDVAIDGQGTTGVTFTDGGVQLTTDCGETSGQWVLDDQGRITADIMRWPSACGYWSPREIAPWLSDAVRVARVSGGITLTTADGSVLATLSDRVGSAPTASTASTPTALPDGARPATRDDVIGSWDSPGAAPFDAADDPLDATGFTARDDGRWLGSDGCNLVSGLWALSEGGALDIAWGGKTLALCAGTEAADQFGQASWAFMLDDSLLLYDQAGAEITRLERTERPEPTAQTTTAAVPSAPAAVSPTATPPGSSPATADDVVGSWDTPGGPPAGVTGETGIVVTADGTFTGSDGCNARSGTWSIAAEGRLVVAPGPSTLIGCEGTPAADHFGLAAWAYVDGDELVLYDSEGAELGRLAPQA